MAIYDEQSNQHSDGSDTEVQYNEFFVDIPKVNGDGTPSEEWYNVQSFKTKKLAIKFAQKHFGADENGMVSLISQS